MSVELPPAIAAYFRADRDEPAAVARCFTPEGVVKDEGRLHRGPEAIAAWKRQASAAYEYTSEPISVEPDGERLIVTAHVVGNFPGSPVTLRYGFTLEGAHIALLEIAP
ncbi:nuclear transport factor 2 family protein [Ancylobacter polymorphus]|jgi:hypothetical protein|uniref:SnoaL-like domain-containing protein n=1 Tax=Ancylobacter polymorphus TaxID=223390 RepID=A0ABU0BAC9_9HYPH|nr:nuclear transport factor 2 family protein [Ancylobacter polymorphus]MDQ0301972.1 hypothetical protein [Ancylobacter polymorphus]